MPKLLKNLFLPVAVLVFAALLAIIMVDSCDELPRREREAIVPTVASVVLQPGPVAVTIHSRGVVTPRWNIDLVSEVSGRVDWVAPEFVQGGEVMEGQLLPPILERHPGVSHRLRDRGEFWKDAVLSGAVRRFRPVVLTSVATFIGLLPIQLETSIQAQFVKPMATSVAFGVLFATFVTLVLVPVLYFVGRDIRALFAGTEAALPAPEQS